MNMGHIAILLSVAFFAAGCGPSATNQAIVALNTAADVAEKANALVLAEYEREQSDAIDNASTREDAEAAIREIKQRYKPAWVAREAFRLVWIDAATAVQLMQATKEEPDMVKIFRILERLAEAQKVFLQSIKKLE